MLHATESASSLYAAPEDWPTTYLFPRDWILHQHQMGQLLEVGQRINIRKLSYVVRRQHERREIRYRLRDRWLDGRNAVPSQEERLQAGREREVGEGVDIVIGEIYGILGLQSISPLTWPKDHQHDRRRRAPASIWGEGWRKRGKTHTSNTQILNGGDLVACTSMTSTQLISKCSISSFQRTHL